MKKSKIWLIVGIVSILLSAIWDAFWASRYDIQNLPNPWPVTVWIWFIVFGVLFLAGVGVIIYSRVLAKREKRAVAQARENVQ